MSKQAEATDGARAFVREATRHLAAHVADRFSMTALAAAVGISASHLRQAFVADLGVSPSAYLAALRVDRAAELLRAGRPVKEVAAAVGFCDPSHLTRRFKQFRGITPARYVAGPRLPTTVLAAEAAAVQRRPARPPRTRPRPAFTLVELLVVTGIVVLLIAILLPSLASARRAAVRTRCLANIHNLEVAQMAYAANLHNQLVDAGDGSYAPQGSWIDLLQPYSGNPLVRRCPGDNSPYFDALDTDLSPAVYRLTSYGLNSYVTSHAPLGTTPPVLITRVPHSSEVVQFVELAETGAYAVADHVHIDEVYDPLLPASTLARLCGQMPVGRHGGRVGGWSGVLNYGFIDGHAEPLPLQSVYVSFTQNAFNPAVVP